MIAAEFELIEPGKELPLDEFVYHCFENMIKIYCL